MADLLLLGAGPLPGDANLTCSYQQRTAKIAHYLRTQSVAFDLAAVDLLSRGETTLRQSLAGDYLLIRRDDRGALYRCLEGKRAVVAVSAPAAAFACSVDPNCPIFADIPGWLIPEAQLKAAAAFDDAAISVYANIERTILARADRIAVVCRNQKEATLGELAALGRVNRQTLDYSFLCCIPSLALDFRELLGGEPPIPASVPPDATVLLFPGSLNFWTDVDQLVALVDALMARLPDLHFVSTGRRVPGYNDEPCDRFEGILAGRSYKDRCRLLPWLPFDQAIGWFLRADLGLCIDADSLEVSHGSRTRIVDMLAHGLPVAASIGTELTGVLDDQQALVSLPQGDDSSWPDRIAATLQDAGRRKELSGRGREAVFATFGLAPTLSGLLDWIATPAYAPDIALRKKLRPWRNGEDPDASFRAERPLVTWRPQAEIEAAARKMIAPAFTRPAARGARRLLPWLFSNRISRVASLAAWNIISRRSQAGRLPEWQGYLDGLLPYYPGGGLSHRLLSRAGRRNYGRVVPDETRSRKALNTLLARHERDLPTGLAARPQRIEIEPSSLCNIRCRMCQLTYMEGTGCHLSSEIFDKLRKLLPDASLVEFIGRGEPTLNPMLSTFLEATLEAGCYVRMFTNGIRLTPELVETMVNRRMHELVLSLPGGTEEVHAAITGVPRLPKILENFRYLRDLKRAGNREFPHQAICSTLLRDSLDSAPAIVRIASNLGIPDVHFGAAYVVMPEMEDQSLLTLDPSAIEPVFDACLNLGSRLGVSVTLPPIGKKATPAPWPAENRLGCLYPWQSLLVRADGQVELCSYNRKIVGDLRKQDPEAIWNGEVMAKCRRGEVRHNGIDYCDWCYHRAFRSRTKGRQSHFPYGITFDGY